jgi:hypothetical protein
MVLKSVQSMLDQLDVDVEYKKILDREAWLIGLDSECAPGPL